MENNPFISSSPDPFFQKEKSTISSPVASEDPSSLPGKDKMKYFRKVGNCNVHSVGRVFRKKRYCFESLKSLALKKFSHILNQVLKTQKTIRKLRVPNEDFCRKRLAYFKPLRRLDLNTLKNTENALSLFRSNFRFLQSLCLSFGRSADFTDGFLCRLARQIKKTVQSLKHLEFDSSSNEIITDIGVKYFADNLLGNYMKSLQGLSLEFLWTFEVTDIGVQTLAEHIGTYLKSLKYLRLQLNQNTTDAGVQSLAEHIGNLKSLKNLQLLFPWNTNISENGVKSLAEHIEKSLSFLQSFVFASDNFTFEELTPFLERFSQCPK